MERTALPENDLADLIRTHYAKYNPAQRLTDVTIIRLDDTVSPNWSARPEPELRGQDHYAFAYALSDVRRDHELLSVD